MLQTVREWQADHAELSGQVGSGRGDTQDDDEQEGEPGSRGRGERRTSSIVRPDPCHGPVCRAG